MAPVAQDDIEMDSHTSDRASQDSSLRRQFSEPLHGHSASTQASQSPSPVAHKFKCDCAADEIENYQPNGTHEQSDVADEEEEQEEEAAAAALTGEAEDDDADGMIEASQNGVTEGVEATEIYEIENDQNAIDDEEGDGEGLEAESDLALSNQLHEFSREQDSISLEKRLHNLWDIHDARNFSADYDEMTTGLDNTWTKVFDDAKRGKKREEPGFLVRPDPYKKAKVGKGEFLEVTNLEDYLIQLRDPEMRSSDELYAITENVSYALRVWQDEFLAIEKLHKIATRHNAKPTSEPRKFERPDMFEDKKESMLYGYRHDPKEDKVNNQSPFVQGGFKPTPAQTRKMIAKAGLNNPNPDGWPIISRFGVEHVPKFQNPPREEFVGKATRKRKAAELEAANRSNETDDAPLESPTLAEPEVGYAGKRRTRTRRLAAEAETQPGGSPASARLSARGRGRGRGRGGARASSRGASEMPQSEVLLAPTRTSGRGHGREGAAPTSGSVQARTGATQLAPLEPAPSGGAARASSVGTAPALDGSLDPAEKARREKIANSKNPKRTEAMLNHWARFNREGRTRNPKRSKAQIEADRAAEAARKATEPPKTAGKKKRVNSPVFGISAGTADPGVAPAPTMSVPGSLAPGHPGTHPQLAPMPAARSMAPYAPIDPRAVAPFPPGPRGPLQQHPPQPYHTPYPDFYMSYGAPAATGMHHPGRTRPA
ncbi:hypothetical protein EYZ11_012760 [Aspergillus tanneri]|uniref:Uncharacterized protein n=1 Tax=Aspergillus tanneri TaxID=1220188 RepID=A0A4S3IZE5_9EURO|nr:hypothetical protein EYZ11_012760 [Aspergillus tanneri]